MKKIFTIASIILITVSGVTTLKAQNMVNLDRFAKENAAIDVPAKGTPVRGRVVFLGDSITEEWIKQDPEFFAGGKFINRGISGEVTDQMLLRFRADVLSLCPKVLVINAGTNDIALNQGPYNEDYTFGNIVSMVELAKLHKIKVILTTVTPAGAYRWRPEVTDSAEKIISLNTRLRKYAIENELEFVDYFSYMVASDGRSMIDELSGDGVHPNLEGYKIMENLINPKIR